jgi:hypothetical protein
MLKPLKTFLGFSAQDRRLVARAVITLIIALARLRTQEVDRVRFWAARRGYGSFAADHLAWAVATASRRSPGATCLVQAVALQHLLSDSGHESELVIGVDKSDGDFAAHAWLVFNDEKLIGGSSAGNYKSIIKWSTQERSSASRLEAAKAT